MLSKVSASGRVLGFLSSRRVTIYLIKGETVSGSGIGYFDLIASIIAKKSFLYEKGCFLLNNS
jgi:hypothetical protein